MIIFVLNGHMRNKLRGRYSSNFVYLPRYLPSEHCEHCVLYVYMATGPGTEAVWHRGTPWGPEFRDLVLFSLLPSLPVYGQQASPRKQLSCERPQGTPRAAPTPLLMRSLRTSGKGDEDSMRNPFLILHLWVEYLP